MIFILNESEHFVLISQKTRCICGLNAFDSLTDAEKKIAESFDELSIYEEGDLNEKKIRLLAKSCYNNDTLKKLKAFAGKDSKEAIEQAEKENTVFSEKLKKKVEEAEAKKGK